MFGIGRVAGFLGRSALALRGGAASAWGRQDSARAGSNGTSGEVLLLPASWPDQFVDGLPFGSYPNDPDAVPRWAIELAERNIGLGIDVPIYRTKREFDEAVERCRAMVEPPPDEDVDDGPGTQSLLPALSPHDAANGFVRFVVSGGSAVEMTSEELTVAYLEWCSDDGRAAAPENLVRDAMKGLPGVSSRQQSRGFDGKRRLRPTVWSFVPTSATTKLETVSFSNGFRRAA